MLGNNPELFFLLVRWEGKRSRHHHHHPPVTFVLSPTGGDFHMGVLDIVMSTIHTTMIVLRYELYFIIPKAGIVCNHRGSGRLSVTGK